MAIKDPGDMSDIESGRHDRTKSEERQSRKNGRLPADAAGPHDQAGLATEATEGTGMLPTPGEASDDDMAPSG